MKAWAHEPITVKLFDEVLGGKRKAKPSLHPATEVHSAGWKVLDPLIQSSQTGKTRLWDIRIMVSFGGDDWKRG